MNLGKRFSIPYTGDSPEVYLNKIEPFKKYIHSIFVGLQCLGDTHFINYSKIGSDAGLLLRELNTFNFLEVCPYPILLCANQNHYDISINELFDKIKQIIDRYNISGVIVSSPSLGCMIKHAYPGLIIHASCNMFLQDEETYTRLSKIGFDVFNPPRNWGKKLDKLKQISGFKLKVILNEACLYTCLQNYEHNFQMFDVKSMNLECRKNNPSKIFKTNVILPQWLEYLDDYVDIFKIVGRGYSLDKLVKTLTIYTDKDTWDSARFSDIAVGGVMRDIDVDCYIKDIPLKTLYCHCSNCDKCKICEDLASNLVRRN